MNTAARARALTDASRHFPLLGTYEAEDLIETVRLELGHAEILDGFRPYAGHFSRAIVRSPILHIVSGNTPHAALQSIIRGLLLGAQNRIKIPSAGLPEVEEFLKHLPPELSEGLLISRELPDAWMRQAKAWIVFGSDETVAHFRKRAPAGVVFVPHAHLFSLGVVYEIAAPAARLAAMDVSRFNQKGCLSPHDIYVKGDARAFAAHLAQEMEHYSLIDPPTPLTTAEAAEVHNLRANYRFRGASDPRVQIWESANSLRWTVIFEEDPWFAASCLNRVVFVKPLPERLDEAMGPAIDWMGAIGVWPATPEAAEQLSRLRPSRICPLGRMQEPPATWHQEGRQNLAPLVDWVDFEPEVG
jgi:Acyl-CoA reductase (LuxC)